MTWADLLKRTIDADIQLAKLGFNPAPKFRQLRNDKNQVSMYTYINGFYQSPFAPNHRSRGAAKSNKISPDTFRRFDFSSKTIQHQHLVPQSTFRGDLRKPARLPSIVITPNAVEKLNLLKLYRELFLRNTRITLFPSKRVCLVNLGLLAGSISNHNDNDFVVATNLARDSHD